jgi:hypothetical protein
MNTFTTFYKNREFSHLLFATVKHDYLQITRAFAPEFEKDTIDIRESCDFDPMYSYPSIDSASIMKIGYIDESGRNMVMNLNCYNSTGIIKFNSKEKCIEINGIIKEYISNVLFHKTIPLDRLKRIEFTQSRESTNYKLLSERKEHLLKYGIFYPTTELMIARHIK